MIIYSQIEQLLVYAQAHLLLDDLDVIYVRNRLLDKLGLDDYVQYEVDEDKIEEMTCPDEVLNPIVDYAVANGIITEADREKFGNDVMDMVSLRPSEVVDMFDSLYETSPAKAFSKPEDYHSRVFPHPRVVMRLSSSKQCRRDCRLLLLL